MESTAELALGVGGESIGRPHLALIDAAALDSLLADADRQSGDRGSHVLLQVLFTTDDPACTASEITETSTSCIPGAISIHPSFVESGVDLERYYPNYRCPDDGNLLADAELHSALASIGISDETEVSVYGHGYLPMMTACRVAWALMYAGVPRVWLLDGGFAAWTRHGGATSAHATVPIALPSFSTRNQQHPCCQCVLATTTEVKATVASGGNQGSGSVVDVRRRGEHDGDMETIYQFFTRGGHIPTSVWIGDWSTLIDTTGKLRSLAAIRQDWVALGLRVDPVEPLIFYCGTGWRSSVAFCVAHLLGACAKNYDSGFFGWQHDPSNEVEVCSPAASH